MFCALGLAHPVTDRGSWYAQSTRLARRHRRRGCRGVYPGADRLSPAAVCPERRFDLEPQRALRSGGYVAPVGARPAVGADRADGRGRGGGTLPAAVPLPTCGSVGILRCGTLAMNG